MKNDFGVIFWFHLSLMIFGYLSPLFFDWKIIVFGVVLLYIQYWVIDGCVVTHWQMGRGENKVFVWYYLSKIWPNLSHQKTKFVVRYVTVGILILIAYYLQVVAGFVPLIFSLQ
jgi:hypothetical protein